MLASLLNKTVIEALTLVHALVQVDQRLLGRPQTAFDDGLLSPQLALTHPLGELFSSLREVCSVIKDDEALHPVDWSARGAQRRSCAMLT